MARKNIIRPFKILAGQSLAAGFQSSPINIDYMDNIGIIIDASSVTDNTGTFTVEARAKDPATNATSSWVNLPLSNGSTVAPPTLADADASFDVFLYNVPYSEFRIVFSAAGGTPDGVADVWIESKQVGG